MDEGTHGLSDTLLELLSQLKSNVVLVESLFLNHRSLTLDYID
jgi:hypothetical protein